jgi:hypothetical protein
MTPFVYSQRKSLLAFIGGVLIIAGSGCTCRPPDPKLLDKISIPTGYVSNPSLPQYVAAYVRPEKDPSEEYIWTKNNISGYKALGQAIPLLLTAITDLHLQYQLDDAVQAALPQMTALIKQNPGEGMLVQYLVENYTDGETSLHGLQGPFSIGPGKSPADAWCVGTSQPTISSPKSENIIGSYYAWYPPGGTDPDVFQMGIPPNCGTSVYNYPDGRKYVGNLESGVPKGMGVMTYPDGSFIHFFTRP